MNVSQTKAIPGDLDTEVTPQDLERARHGRSVGMFLTSMVVISSGSLPTYEPRLGVPG